MEFLDVGSYGIWGEWHTTHPAPVAVRQHIVDMYLKAFPKTALVFMSDDGDVMGYALAHGAGIRRDGVGSPWHEQNWIGSPRYAGVQGMADAWKKAPVVFEWYGDYTLAIALVDPANPARTLNLAMDAPAKEGWYLVGQARVE